MRLLLLFLVEEAIIQRKKSGFLMGGLAEFVNCTF